MGGGLSRASRPRDEEQPETCPACRAEYAASAVYCLKCGLRRSLPSWQVDTDTELDKLLSQAELALSQLSSRWSWARPFRRRRALREMQQVLERMRMLPMSKLMRTHAVPQLNLAECGLDKDTGKFLSGLLGWEKLKDLKGNSRSCSKVSTFSTNSTHADGFLATPGASTISGVTSDPEPSSPSSTASPCGMARLLTVAASPPTGRAAWSKICDWSTFDVFEAACTVAPGTLFQELFIAVDMGLNILEPLKLSMETLAPALNAAQATYEDPHFKKANMYHTALHGAEVMCSAVAMLTQVPRKCLGDQLPPLARFSLTIAALCHDIRHPGVQARFLEAVHHPLTFTYADDSPIERMHVAETLRLMHKYGITQGFREADHKRFRRLISSMILATDLSQGYRNVATIKAAFPALFSEAPGSKAKHEIDGGVPSSDVSIELMSLVVECADISHPAKSLELHQRWSVLITHEFLQQGKMEEMYGLPISPLCSSSCTLDPASFARSQQGFIDFVVRPKLTVLSKLCGQDGVWLKRIDENHSHWGSSAVCGFVQVDDRIKNNPHYECALVSVRRATVQELW